MEFNNEENSFGIQSVESIGTPQLFSSSPDDVEPITEEDTTIPKAEEGFDLGTGTPQLFAEAEVEEPKTIPVPPTQEIAEQPSTETTEENTEETNTEEVVETNNIPIFYKTLLEQGLVSELADGEVEPENPEDLLRKFQEQGQLIANDTINTILGKFGQDRIDFFNAVFVNGVNPKDYFTVEQQLNSVKGIDLGTVENQEQVIAQYYKGIGWSNEKIKKHLKRLDEDGDTESEATDAYNNLVQVEEEKLRQVVAQQAQQAHLKQQEEAFYRQQMGNILLDKLKNKEFNGVPFTDKVARQTNEFLTVYKWQLPSGEQLTDFDKWLMDLRKPENYEERALVATLKGIEWDFEKIKKKAISKESNKLFEGLVQKEKTTNNRSNTQTQPNFTGFKL